MFKTLRIFYDGKTYEVRYSGHVIEGISFYPEGSMLIEDIKLEQLDEELQDLIIQDIMYGQEY